MKKTSQNIYIKERVSASERNVTAYTTLTGLLRSEGMQHIYRSAWLLLSEGKTLNFNNLLIYKIKLNHEQNNRSGNDPRNGGSTADQRNRSAVTR